MGLSSHRFHTDAEWLSLIEECRSSGLSDSAWCRRNAIPSSSFYTAVKRLRNKACTVPPKSTEYLNDVQEVVPVTFNEPVTTFNSANVFRESEPFATVQIVVNDYKIQISDGCAKETIKNTLLALKELC